MGERDERNRLRSFESFLEYSRRFWWHNPQENGNAKAYSDSKTHPKPKAAPDPAALTRGSPGYEAVGVEAELFSN